MSDGVYDNFDPQHMGLTPRDVDSLFEYDDWHLAPPNIAESLKTQFIAQRLEKMFNDFADEELKVHSRFILARFGSFISHSTNLLTIISITIYSLWTLRSSLPC